MKALIIHRYFWPENVSAFALMLGTLAAYHRKRGDSVSVVCGQSEDFRTAIAEELGSEIEVVSFRAPLDRVGGVGRRVANSIKLVMLAIRALWAGDWDMVYVVSYPPGIAFFLTSFIRMTRSARHVIYFVQDNHIYRVPTAVLRWMFSRVQAATLRRSSRIVTLSDQMKDELASVIPPGRRAAEARKIAVIPNFSPDSVSQIGTDSSRARDIIYAGSHGVSQNLDHFVRMIEEIDADGRPMVDFFGDGPQKRSLVRLVDERGLSSWIRFHPNLSREAVSAEMSRSRFGLVAARPGLFRFAFPSKLASYNMAGIRSLVMCDRHSRFATWLEDEGIGFAIGEKDPTEGARRIVELLANQASCGNPSEVSAAAERLYGREAWIMRVDELVRGLERDAPGR